MDRKKNFSNKYDGFLYGNTHNTNPDSKKVSKRGKYKSNEDPIIEDNTVYEIDRQCYEKLIKKNRRKT